MRYFTKVCRRPLLTGASVLILAGCGQNSAITPDVKPNNKGEATTAISIPFEKFTLDNGLDVILHVDRSDPIVAIDLAVHVGSARELPGRTGFAHLFEHLLFLDSENLGYGGLDEMNTRIGGVGTNGFTTNDMTQYFQAVPADALEKVIWAEADKLGYFIKTVSQDVVDNEKQVVKNEKRQRNDNAPYGHTFPVVAAAMYPKDHPYNWSVIGSLTDLDAATLEDVQNFYKRWYVPNNVTVTISGDFKPAEAKRLVEKYFGEIPRGADTPRAKRRPAVLDKTLSLYHLDNFATAPRTMRIWPTVEEYHPDSYALEILSTYLTDGKRAPLNEVMIDEEKITTRVFTFTYAKELAGEFWFGADANEGEDIDDMQDAIAKAFMRFETNGISETDLQKIKTAQEVSLYDEIQNTLQKAIQLGEYNIFKGDPGFYKTDLARLQAVTPADVMRVYNTYIKDKPYITTSFVPKDAPELALDGAIKADVTEEVITKGAEKDIDFDPAARVIDTPTPSAFDRSVEPDFGTAYALPTPKIWRETLDNGARLIGIENDETPLVYLNIAIDAGRKRGTVDKPAIASLTADMMEKGTENRSNAEIEAALKELGSTINFSTSADTVDISISTLSRNLEATLSILEDMLLTPGWDETEFDLWMKRTIESVKQEASSPRAIANREAAKLRYPADHPFHYAGYGPVDKLEDVTLDDLKAFYAAHYTPKNAVITVAGDASPAKIKTAFATITQRWTTAGPPDLTLPQPNDITQSRIYFYDVPGAKQSVLSLQRPSLSAKDDNYALMRAVNFPLGGIYTSKLNTKLRVEKGYTYGIGSRFTGSLDRGLFTIGSSVRSNVTYESLDLIKDILKTYGPEFTEDDLETLKQARLRGQALSNETLSQKLSMLNAIAAYDYPDDYRTQNAAKVQDLSLAQFKALTAQYIKPDAMNYLIVGDAETQANGLEGLGFGPPVMIKPNK